MSAPTLPVGRQRLSSDLPVVAKAHGSRIYDEDGREFIDGSSGTICVNIGHGSTDVLAAMREQAELVTFAHRSQFTSRSVLALTEKILSIGGPGYREVVYTNSGSEATETALRLALFHHALAGSPERSIVLTQQPSYHGMTAGALSVSGHPPRREHLDALVSTGVSTVPVTSDDPAADPLPATSAWEEAFGRIGPERIAAVLVEPVSGAAGGAAVLRDDVLRRLRELTSASGALLVMDEVMTGFGRTGDWFGYQRSGVTPDLVVTGKGLSGGYTPIGAVLVGASVLPGRSASDLALGHTMSGNPLSAAVALAVLRVTEQQRLPERAERIGAELRRRLEEEVTGKVGFLDQPRGRGLLLGLPVRQAAGAHARAPLAATICRAAREFGLVVYPAGVNHWTQALLVAPSLTIEDAELAELVRRLARTVTAVDTQLARTRGRRW
ncbi:N(6)-acetyl-beta-lysine transaminase precursor [Frankia casuarinae]|nr:MULTISPECIES: aminotransferase class III-fold pyridoxal phosphate-dependent enzyme [Frankia]KEZ34280.1 adenosylmethionine-8-amino-7-oxononanoate aminotransferase [Frankia sp. CeD]ETA00361.1 N(6)-acetyl-beta-lysine transaminase precursor [Frankia sp. CcI6]EYT89648.1 N(6)-acetyl-beta-lysine transaminase precursor [Frankia casuarinae]KDA40673.1 N(6)-acetyl-beta-lysine transaminase precursor [Frankia sp. BMG5.23]OAA18613.1 N(6)-acetyl-beta-lysine transaminase precursor [Frankia casuarinae]